MSRAVEVAKRDQTQKDEKIMCFSSTLTSGPEPPPHPPCKTHTHLVLVVRTMRNTHDPIDSRAGVRMPEVNLTTKRIQKKMKAVLTIDTK